MFDFSRRSRERQAAVETVDEVFAALKPAMDANRSTDPAELIERYRGTIAVIFGSACERNKLQTETSARRAFDLIEPELRGRAQAVDRIAESMRPPR